MHICSFASLFRLAVLPSHFVCKMKYRFSKLFFLPNGMVGFERSRALVKICQGSAYFNFVFSHPLATNAERCVDSF